MSAPKRPCLDGEGLELAFQQAQENMERLRRQMEESAARQIAPPATAAPPVANLQPAAESQPATIQQPPASNQPASIALPLPNFNQPSPSANQRQPPPPRTIQPSFASASFDNGYRGRSRRGRDTRGRLFYVYVCRQHTAMFCQSCGDYISSELFFNRNPDIDY